jgi:hypothetical protein
MFHLFMILAMPVILVILQPGQPPVVVRGVVMKVKAAKPVPAKKCKTKL